MIMKFLSVAPLLLLIGIGAVFAVVLLTLLYVGGWYYEKIILKKEERSR